MKTSGFDIFPIATARHNVKIAKPVADREIDMINIHIDIESSKGAFSLLHIIDQTLPDWMTDYIIKAYKNAGYNAYCIAPNSDNDKLKRSIVIEWPENKKDTTV